MRDVISNFDSLSLKSAGRLSDPLFSFEIAKFLRTICNLHFGPAG